MYSARVLVALLPYFPWIHNHPLSLSSSVVGRGELTQSGSKLSNEVMAAISIPVIASHLNKREEEEKCEKFVCYSGSLAVVPPQVSEPTPHIYKDISLRT